MTKEYQEKIWGAKRVYFQYGHTRRRMSPDDLLVLLDKLIAQAKPFSDYDISDTEYCIKQEQGEPVYYLPQPLGTPTQTRTIEF